MLEDPRPRVWRWHCALRKKVDEFCQLGNFILNYVGTFLRDPPPEILDSSTSCCYSDFDVFYALFLGRADRPNYPSYPALALSSGHATHPSSHAHWDPQTGSRDGIRR